MKIVVIGGSGLIGSKLVPRLREQGHEAVAASPSSGVNCLTGEGLAEAMKGASVIVDVSNAPSWEDAAVMNFFETATRNTLDVAAIPVLKSETHLPVIVDPSHAGGMASLVAPLAFAGMLLLCFTGVALYFVVETAERLVTGWHVSQRVGAAT